MVETLRTDPITRAPATGVDDGVELGVILFQTTIDPHDGGSFQEVELGGIIDFGLWRD